MKKMINRIKRFINIFYIVNRDFFFDFPKIKRDLNKTYDMPNWFIIAGFPFIYIVFISSLISNFYKTIK
jgi:hypothetical protein